MDDTQVKVGDTVPWMDAPSGSFIQDSDGDFWIRQGDRGHCMANAMCGVEAWNTWAEMEDMDCGHNVTWEYYGGWWERHGWPPATATILALNVPTDISIADMMTIVAAHR